MALLEGEWKFAVQHVKCCAAGDMLPSASRALSMSRCMCDVGVQSVMHI
jgi:hypothetical protein